MPTYSFGEDSPLKFEIPDNLALYYNEAVAEFFKAQTRFNQKFGRTWDPNKDAISIGWSKKQRKAWNDFARVFKTVLEKDGPFHVNDISDDFLVKNVASAASSVSDKWLRAVGAAAMCGALYGLLRGR